MSNTLTSTNGKQRIDDTYVVMSSAQANASVMEDRSPTLLAVSQSPPMVAGNWPAQKASTLNTKYADKQGLEDQHINSGAPLFVPYPTLYEPASLLEENWREKETKGALVASVSKSAHAVVSEANIRRMTPLEWERLQGFPDHYTAIKGAKDAPRYKAPRQLDDHPRHGVDRPAHRARGATHSPKTQDKMIITIDTDAHGPKVTLAMTPAEFENYKAVLKAVNTTRLTPEQTTLHDQVSRNLNRLSFGKAKNT